MNTRTAMPVSTVCLVGQETESQENLGLRYVAAALVEAGHRIELMPLDDVSQIDTLAQRIMAEEPRVVGLAISDQRALLPHLLLARSLRRRGFAGHITAGGPFATLTRHDLLATQPALDSVVRHAGELPMTELVRTLEAGASVERVAGLTTRAGDGVPAAVAASVAARPLRREQRPRYMGVPAASLIASRGCNGTCQYCGSHALRRMAMEEGRLGGMRENEMLELGVGRRRRRPVADVADEAAELYHEHGVRIFSLLDDNLLGNGEGSLEYVRGLRRALRARRVDSCAWSLMIDADSVDAAMLDEFEALGVIRVLVGIEALTDTGLRALGRPGSAEGARRAIEQLVERRVVTTFNGMLVHPETNGDSIQAELEALANIRGAYFEVIPLLLYPGTDAQRRLCREGRATGGTFGYYYRPTDPVGYRFMAAQARFSQFAGDWYDAGVYVHGLHTHAAIARRLGLPEYSSGLEQRILTLLNDSTARMVRAFQSALAVSRVEMGTVERQTAVEAIVHRLRSDLLPIWQQARQLRSQIDPRFDARHERRGLFAMRENAMAYVIAAASVALACGGEVDSGSAQHDQTGSGSSGAGSYLASGGADGDTTSSLRGGSSTVGGGSAFGGTAAIARGGSSALGGIGSQDPSRGGTSGAESTSQPIPSLPVCGDFEEMTFPEWNTTECSPEKTCNQARNLDAEPGCPTRLHYYVDAEGHVVDVAVAYGRLTEEQRVEILSTLSSMTFPCLADGEFTGTCLVTLF